MTQAYLSLALLWFAAVVIPGPNFMAILSRAAEKGRCAAVLTALGCVAGTAVWAAAGFFGLKALFATLPVAATAIKLAGAAYLIWTGTAMWRAASRPLDALPHAGRRDFVFGLATTLANPKTAAFAASLFAVALPADAGTGAAAAAILLVCTVSVAWYAPLGLLGGSRAVRALYARALTPLRRAVGAIFVGYGLILGWSEVRK